MIAFRMVEEKIGNDEKGADMNLWKKNPSLGDVSACSTNRVELMSTIAGFRLNRMGLHTYHPIRRQVRS